MQKPHEDKNPPVPDPSPVPQAPTSQGAPHSTSAAPHIDEDLDQLLSKPGQLERLQQASPFLHWLFTQKEVPEFLSKRKRLAGIAKQVVLYHHVISDWVTPIHAGIAVALLLLAMQWFGFKSGTVIEFGDSATKGVDFRLTLIGVWFCAVFASLSGSPLVRPFGLLFIRPVVWLCHGAALVAVGALLILVPYALMEEGLSGNVSILAFGIVLLSMVGVVLQAAKYFLDAEEGSMGEPRWARISFGLAATALLSGSLWLEFHKTPQVSDSEPTAVAHETPGGPASKQGAAIHAASR